jgi:hypothetical protein
VATRHSVRIETRSKRVCRRGTSPGRADIRCPPRTVTSVL